MNGLVIANNVTNYTEFVDFTSMEASLGSLVTLFKILGGVLLFYVVYWTVMAIINLKKVKAMNKIILKLEAIDKKLDKFNKIKK